MKPIYIAIIVIAFIAGVALSIVAGVNWDNFSEGARIALLVTGLVLIAITTLLVIFLAPIRRIGGAMFGRTQYYPQQQQVIVPNLAPVIIVEEGRHHDHHHDHHRDSHHHDHHRDIHHHHDHHRDSHHHHDHHRDSHHRDSHHHHQPGFPMQPEFPNIFDKFLNAN